MLKYILPYAKQIIIINSNNDKSHVFELITDNNKLNILNYIDLLKICFDEFALCFNLISKTAQIFLKKALPNDVTFI